MTFKITIPAVKISPGPTPLPLLPDEESLLCPDPCHSLTNSIVKLEPIDSSKVTTTVTIPMPATTLTDEEENEAEFGEFLLDAVDWL